MRLAPPLLAWTSAVACAASGGPDRVPEGKWGGEHVALTVEASGARVELDCAYGALTAPLVLNAEGAFDVPGYYAQEFGGPAREEEDDRRPARYSGTSDGRVIRFSIQLNEGGSSIGPFSATLGEPPRLVKCPSHLDP